MQLAGAGMITRKEERKLRTTPELAALVYYHHGDLLLLLKMLEVSVVVAKGDNSEFWGYVQNQLNILSLQDGVDFKKIPKEIPDYDSFRRFSSDIADLPYRHSHDIAYIVLDSARYFGLKAELENEIKKMEKEREKFRKQFAFDLKIID